MDRRRQPRVPTFMPVRVWGLDANSLPFVETATVTNISGSGAVVQGLTRRVKPGEILDVQLGQEKAQFRVVWAAWPGTPAEGEMGLERLELEPCLWETDLCRFQLAAEG